MDSTNLVGKMKVFEQYRFFREASAELQAEMLTRGNEVQAPVGMVLFASGGSCADIALIGAGSIRVFISNDAGREITLYHVGAGETCPINLLGALQGRPVPATAVVETKVHAVALPGAAFREWMRQHEGVRSFLIDGLAGRFVDVFEQVHEISFGKLDERLADFLMKRFAESGDTPPSCVGTHEQIASELSTAREVVSRLLREFERTGAVDLGRGRITLRNAASLARFQR
jgi:CRP/FNR family transcriptional regulator